MKIIHIDHTDRSRVKQFLNLPFRLYRHTPQWVPPLETDARLVFDRRRHPFYRQSQAAFFLAYDEADIVIGRLAILNNRRYNDYNHEQTGFFSLYECENNIEATRALFTAAFEWARDQGLNKIVGPKGFSVFDGIGMLVNGFEHRPAYGLPYNLPYYPALVEGIGFVKEGELVSGYLDETMRFPEKIKQVADILKKRRGLHVAQVNNRRELKRILPYLKELYNSALGGTQGNTPLSDEEINAMADQMLWFADPHLVKIVMKGDQPVGFLLAYPDISAALQKARGHLFPFGWLFLLWELHHTKWININGAGMVEGYRGLGGTALLFSEMYKSVAETRYRYADLVQVGVENDRMLREMRELGIILYKMHRTYQILLT